MNIIFFIVVVASISFVICFLLNQFRDIVKKYTYEEYGEANISFHTSMCRISPRPSAFNPTTVNIYDDFLYIICGNLKWIINKDNFLEYKKATMFVPYIIKIKTEDIYKSKELYFLFTKKQAIHYLQVYYETIHIVRLSGNWPYTEEDINVKKEAIGLLKQQMQEIENFFKENNFIE